MNLENFKKTKEELEEQKKENDKTIRLSDERTRMAKVNSLEYKGGTTLAFSMMGYLPIFLISSALIKHIGVTAFTNVIPAFSFPAIVVGGSLGIGTIIRTLMDKKYQTKERLKAFSTAKTQAEKLEEEIHYQIELEKANNRNVVLDQAINVLNSNESMLRRMSSKYDINDKSTAKNEEESRKRIEELSALIKEQYDKLDILSTQKVLHDRFWRIRSKFQKGTDMSMSAGISGMFTMFFTGFPLMMVNDAITYSSLFSSLATTFTPFIAGIAGACGYMAKRNKDHKKVFNNFNSQLGENALPETYEKYEGAYEEQEEIKKLIEKQVRDISMAIIQLKEEQQVLESMVSANQLETPVKSKDKSKSQEDILFQDFPQLHITEETRRDVLEHPEKYSDCDARTRMGMFYTDEEKEEYIEESLSRDLPGGKEKGPTLVKRRIPPKK